MAGKGDYRYFSLKAREWRLLRLPDFDTATLTNGRETLRLPLDVLFAFADGLVKFRAGDDDVVTDTAEGAEKAPRGVTGESDT